jgi:hypothetical protein
VRNRLHFGQANGTPFSQPELASAIPWGVDSVTSKQILSGTYVPPSTVHALCSRVIQQCRSHQNSDAIPPGLNLESFRGKMREWRESTTTSPSGRHLGRYKALFSKGNHDPTNINAVESFKSKQQAIASVILMIINFCIRTGHVLERWKVVVNTMIFKDPGNFCQIHRLEPIDGSEVERSVASSRC